MRIITATSPEYPTREKAVSARIFFIQRFLVAFPNAREITGEIFGAPGHYVVTMLISLD